MNNTGSKFETMTTRKTGLLVLLISFVLFSAGSGRSSIYILDESKNAQCAWEMMHSSDHVIPTFNGELRTAKPPLHYYIMMAGYAIFGKSSLGARIFSAVFGALMMWVLFLFVNRYAGRRVALWCMAALLGSVLWVIEFHLAVPDPYLIVFLTLGFISFFHFTATNLRWTVYVMYLCFSLAFLTKGPVGVGLPGIIILIYLIITKKFTLKYIWSMRPLEGLAIFAVTALPWYLLVHNATDGEWTRGFFLDENIKRYTGTKEGHGGSFLLTLGYYIVGMLPFFAFLPGIIRNAWRERKSNLVIYSSLIAVAFIVFFAVSKTKLPNYAMPSFPFAAILTAFYLSKAVSDNVAEQVNVRIGLWVLFVVSILIPAGLTFGVRFEPLLSDVKGLGLWYLFMPVGLGLALFFEHRLRYRSAFQTVALTFTMAAVVSMTFVMPVIDKHNPVSATIGLLERSGSVKSYSRFNPSFVFNYGEIEQLVDTALVSNHLSDTANIIITSVKAVNKAPEFWEKYRVVYSGKDLFDINHTLIFKGEGNMAVQ